MQFGNAAIQSSRIQPKVIGLLGLVLLSLPALAQITITSPISSSTNINAVPISISAKEGSSFSHMEVYDNGYKLGDIFGTSTASNTIYALPNGSHTMTVLAVDSGGNVLDQSNVAYTVAENCDSNTTQCDMDQIPNPDNTQLDCNPIIESVWVANPCGNSIQGSGGSVPTETNIATITESGTFPDQEETTLNGKSVHLSEQQGSGGYSNVLFQSYSPNQASRTTVDSNWILDEYVYLPNPLEHQSIELDAHYVIAGIWTKFDTQCAFNMIGSGSASTGYWSIFDTQTGGWLYLEGQKLPDGTYAPKVPCSRAQWSQPWSYSGTDSRGVHSSNPTFSGWHHVVWHLKRNSYGTATYVSLTLDGATTVLNYSPPGTGGTAGNNGDFSAPVQLDGAKNSSGNYNTVDAYVNELNVTHTQ